MHLFDDMDHSDGLPRAQETRFAYLNRSARPEAARIRQFLTACVDHYPAEARDALISRLRGDDEGHDSALFELLVHELLLRSGFRILAIEPVLPHTKKSPDFLVEAPDGEHFYLECVVSSGRSDKDSAANKRLDDALEAAGAVPSPVHYLAVRIGGRPNAPIKLKTLKAGLAAWIATLPPGAAARRARPYKFTQNGLTLSFSAMSERRGNRPDGDRTLGAIHYGIGVRRPGKDLRSSLVGKAGKYGELGLPFVVAINNTDTGGNERDLLDALLGSPAAVFEERDGEMHARGTRANDGVWTESNRPRKRGLSAVWSFDRMSAWSPMGRAARLVRNPWASRPLPPMPLPSDALNPENGEFVRVEGRPPSTWFGLHERWPE